MANYINKYGETLWYCNNALLDIIHETLAKTYTSQNIPQNKAVSEFIDRLNQDIYGCGCVLADIDILLTNKEDLGVLIQLYAEACKIILEKHPSWTPEAKARLLMLYDVLKQEYDKL